MAPIVLERALADEAATIELGEDLAMMLGARDTVLLEGDLGAGKTTLARAVIRALADDHTLEVPSPTFTIAQSYDTRLPVQHLDLFRLRSQSELEELGGDDLFGNSLVLVEWPERAAARMPADAITVALREIGVGRTAGLSGPPEAIERIERSLAIRDFLSASGMPGATRRPFAGDASARSFELIVPKVGEPLILMNSPRLKLGQAVRDGRSYAEIAHTAQTATAFVSITRLLSEKGLAAPGVVAADLDRGFILVTHLGDGSVLTADGLPVPERWHEAARLLAAMHGMKWPKTAKAGEGIMHEIPPFDRGAMAIEVSLMLDWYIPYVTGSQPAAALREEFEAIWNRCFDRMEHAEKTLMLRDFQSTNLIWRPRETGVKRVGLVDFQDALIGPPAYDVASLAMDARVSIEPELERSTLDAYVTARRAAGPFDAKAFEQAYAIMAAQRNTKILGIFVRLDRRDGKPGYLKHLPRIRDYLRRAFEHPALGELAEFYERHGLLAEPSS